MNLNMVKPEKLAHLHLVYHLTVPLNTFNFRSYLFLCCPDSIIIKILKLSYESGSLMLI